MFPGVATEVLIVGDSDLRRSELGHCNVGSGIVNGAKKNGPRKSAGRFASFVHRIYFKGVFYAG